MSYILEALRKSEAERRQGKAPDLGQPVQMIYRPRKKPVAAMVWVGLALLLNAVVLGTVFWPELRSVLAGVAPAGEPVSPTVPVIAEPAVQPEEAPVVLSPDTPDYGEPTIIVPRTGGQNAALTDTSPPGRVPHLVELPLSFQKSVPDLTFNSHIVSSNPSASSVMVNNQYLRAGDRLGALLLENIGDDAVVFRKDDQRFRVGTQRNWVSPD
ncbi:general secretion pathway protein B [Marinobacter persicus]|uniref:General secretion pathway protein B n=1 Tax=Marinobacter persicus TaxID=930118 RepID=A0A1I3TVN5_9GAMM|nr:general secretion pathway protein GspB [Marinobacter persicus]GHD45760.1 hypothetical protein GCM10008110_11980 [Marinobacter persicus]SFJ74379.1 general secretion pathway protein B [Marinobacter persicus]